ncbi:MAG: vWA domain-containing protein [Sphaerochaetaceae bacterium]
MKSKRVLILVLAVFIVLTAVACDLVSSTVESLFDGGFVLPPTIATNTINFEITGVGTGLRGYDNFPSITLFVQPKNPADSVVIPNLVEADFFDVIDDNGEARPIEVTPRGSVTTSNNMADIVFVIDTTGSMYGYLDTMVTKAQDFADTLEASDVDYRVGYVTFGDDIRKGDHERLAPTSDILTFKTEIDLITAYGGDDSPENQIDAIDYARAGTSETTSNPAGSFQNDMGFLYRDAAIRMFVLITDIDYHEPGESYSDVLGYYPGGVANTVAQEIAKLNATGAVCYVVAPSYYEDDYEELATGTGGAFFDGETDFAGIIDTIGEEITTRGDYMITFMTNDFTANKLHTLRLAVHTSLGDAQGIVTYTSPAVVNYTRAMEIYEAGLAE